MRQRLSRPYPRMDEREIVQLHSGGDQLAHAIDLFCSDNE
jgi:hypothetical protein